MKLKEYLIEEQESLASYIPKIKTECKPFLKDIRGAAGTLFRIDSKGNKRPVWKKVTRKDRKPLDTNIDIHKFVDDKFLKEFGWRARSNVLFCWPLPFKGAFLMGKYMVFPAGGYKYIWSTFIDDLWGALGDIPGGRNDVGFSTDYFEENLLPSYTDKGIKMSIKYENEIMIKCDYSYLIRSELMEQINEMLDLNWQGAVYKGRKI